MFGSQGINDVKATLVLLSLDFFVVLPFFNIS